MTFNKETKMINQLFAIIATSALVLFVFVPQALIIPATWFVGHLCIGIYRAYVKNYITNIRTFATVRA